MARLVYLLLGVVAASLACALLLLELGILFAVLLELGGIFILSYLNYVLETTWPAYKGLAGRVSNP